ASMMGAVIRRIITRAERGYQVDPDEVVAAMNSKTCAIILNSPGNPTGTVYPRETIQAICSAAAERGIVVISDEVYDRLVLDGGEYPSALALAPDPDSVIVGSSFSKTYSMPGLRIGWLVSGKRNIETLRRYHMFTTTVGNTPGQWAAAAALRGDQAA